MVYYAYFHSVMCYSSMFCGNSSYATNIFRAQERVIRVMLGIGSSDSCRQSFVVLGILPLLSQYIFSLLCYVVNNIHIFHSYLTFMTEILDSLNLNL
jgi:hypothetical protein